MAPTRPSHDLIDKLKHLGISERSARFALSKCNNNVEQAAEYVFSGKADKDEVSDNGLGRSKNGGNEDNGHGLEEVSEHSAPSSSRWPYRFNRKPELSSSSADNAMVIDASEPIESTDMRLTQRALQSADPVFFEQQSADLIMNALGRSVTPSSRSSTPQPRIKDERRSSKEAKVETAPRPAAGALAALGFRAAQVAGPTVQAPSPTEEKKEMEIKQPKPSKSHLLPSRPVGRSSEERPSRSPSPFFRTRKSREERRERDRSPEIQALRKDSATGDQSAAESDGEGVLASGRGRSGAFRPQASAYESPDESGDDSGGVGPLTEDEHDHDDTDHTDHEHDSELEHDLHSNFTDDDHHDADDDADHHDSIDDDDDDDDFDDETLHNTEANAIYDAPNIIKADGPDTKPADADPCASDTFDVYGEEVEQDVLGEGPNVVVPPEPVFQAPTTTGVKRRTSKKGLELVTSRPTYGRDRCTITITQGDPDGALDKTGKRMRRYVVLSDLSEESRYAVEWAVGTVARDGDELFLINVNEDESKVDPKSWSAKEQQLKLRVQKERQTTALLLVRQVTSLLSRTRLNITVTCQALHAKNARYMLLDLIDFLEPTIVIVGSRGLGQLKGILLGSTSHYLVQKSSVPVMVARRRMYRPLRRTDPEALRHSPRVSLASANIEKTASSKAEDDIVDAAVEDEAEAEAAVAARK